MCTNWKEIQKFTVSLINYAACIGLLLLCIFLEPLTKFSWRQYSLTSIFRWLRNANSYYPRWAIIGEGNSSNFKTGWDRGLSVPGAFKLDHLQPVEPLLLWNVSNFSTFILGSQFLLPQRANNQKRKFSQLQNWMRQRGLSAWDIQTGSFAAW